MSVYKSLHRLRQYARQESELQVRKAQEERDAQLARIEELRAEVQRAREDVDPDDAGALAAYQAWRLRAEMSERRESARLAQRERDLEQHTRTHADNVRKELTMETFLELQAERALEDARRVDARNMDEIAGNRRDLAQQGRSE